MPDTLTRNLRTDLMLCHVEALKEELALAFKISAFVRAERRKVTKHTRKYAVYGEELRKLQERHYALDARIKKIADTYLAPKPQQSSAPLHRNSKNAGAIE